MRKILEEILGSKLVYRLITKWSRFIYSFNIMVKNKSGRIHLGNGYCLNFETMTIEEV